MLFPWALAVYKEASERFELALLMAGFQRFRDETELRAVSPALLNAEVWDDYLQPARANYRILMSFAMRMDVLRESGGFTKQNICLEGHDLFLRVGTPKGFVYIHAPTIYAYRQHSVSQSRDITPLYKGARLMLTNEQRGVYPGGSERRLELAIFLGRMLKYSVERCIEHDGLWRGFDLYWRGLAYFHKSGYWPCNAGPLGAIKVLRKRRGMARIVRRTRPALSVGDTGRDQEL
jgi:hypothetical protein